MWYLILVAPTWTTCNDCDNAVGGFSDDAEHRPIIVPVRNAQRHSSKANAENWAKKYLTQYNWQACQFQE